VSTLRCFVGIPLDAEAAQWASEARRLIEELAPGWVSEKWVPVRNLHVTLQFLGAVEEAALAPLEIAIGNETAGLSAFTLELTGVAARPSPRRSRMLWGACTDTDGGFSRVVRAVERGSARLGIGGDMREQAPHITLCRARTRRSIPDVVIAQVNEALGESRRSMSVPSYSLFTSRLAPRGPEYQQIATWRLRGE